MFRMGILNTKGQVFSVLEALFSALYSGTGDITVPVFLLIMLFALLLGALEAFVYRKNNPCSRSFAVTLAMLPAVVSVVIRTGRRRLAPASRQASFILKPRSISKFV